MDNIIVNQPNFDVAATALHAAGNELAKCTNLPAIQQGEVLIAMIQQSETRIMAQLHTMSTKFQNVETQQQVMSGQLQTMSAKLQTVDERLQTVDERLQTLEAQQQTMSGQLQTLEAQQQTMSGQLQTLEAQQQTMSGQLQTLDERQQNFTIQLEEISTRQSVMEHNGITRAQNGMLYNVDDHILPLHDVRNEPIDPFPLTIGALDRLRGLELNEIFQSLGMRVDGTVAEKRHRL